MHTLPAEWLPVSIAPADRALEVCVLDFPLAGNRIIEAGRTVTLQLQAPSEGLLIDQPVASAQVVDDDGTVSISAARTASSKGTPAPRY